MGLLWKHERDVTAKMMPSSESEVMARQRTLKCAQRLKANPVLKAKVEDRVQEFLDKGQAEVVKDPSVCQDIVWYMPPVIVEHEGKDKPRYCHDAKAECNGISLNKMLIPGSACKITVFNALQNARRYD